MTKSENQWHAYDVWQFCTSCYDTNHNPHIHINKYVCFYYPKFYFISFFRQIGHHCESRVRRDGYTFQLDFRWIWILTQRLLLPLRSIISSARKTLVLANKSSTWLLCVRGGKLDHLPNSTKHVNERESQKCDCRQRER